MLLHAWQLMRPLLHAPLYATFQNARQNATERRGGDQIIVVFNQPSDCTRIK
jgi:hypothetical protein